MKYSIIVLIALIMPLTACKEKLVPANEVYSSYLTTLNATENMNELKPYLSKQANDGMTQSIVKFEEIGKTADEGFGIVLEMLKKVESCVENRQLVGENEVNETNKVLNYTIENKCVKTAVEKANPETEVRSFTGKENIAMVNENGWKIKEIEVRMDEANKEVESNDVELEEADEVIIMEEEKTE